VVVRRADDRHARGRAHIEFKGVVSIRAATAADVPAIADIVDQAYRHYIARMGTPPGPMLDDYTARVSEGVVWTLEERTAMPASSCSCPGRAICSSTMSPSLLLARA